MHRLKILLGALTVLAIASCEGPTGPPGIDGLPGVNIKGQVLEIENVNFDYIQDSNLWSTLLITFSDFNFEVIEGDAILIYRYEETITLDDGSTTDVWSQIPQNFFIEQGTVQYVFNHSFVDCEIFIDGNFDLSTLDSGFTDNQIFRIVAVPAEVAKDASIDLSNLNALMDVLEVNGANIQKIAL